MKILIRLDDACPTMNHSNWLRMESLLDKYSIKPIVGVIPDNKDDTFCWKIDDSFWDEDGIIHRWQNKGWELSMHGLHHVYNDSEVSPYKCFYKSHVKNSEFVGLDYEKQISMIRKGYKLLTERGLQIRSFYAPAHTFDENTVNAIRNIDNICFISDGYALSAYKDKGVIFIPSICDTPFSSFLNNSLFTFVYHPSTMSDNDFKSFEDFIKLHINDFIEVDDSLKKIRKSQGIVGKFIEIGMYLLRFVHKNLKY